MRRIASGRVITPRTRPYSARTSPIGQMVDRMFEEAFAPFYTTSQRGNGGSTGFQSLPVNLWETNDAYHAALMAPGVDEQSLNVTVHDNSVVT